MWGKGWHEPHGMGVPAEIVLPIYQCHAQATAQRQASVWLIIEVSGNLGSGTDDHHFGGFDQRRGGLAFFQAQIAAGVAGNNRGDGLAANIKRHFGHQAGGLNFGNAAHQLVPAADEVLKSLWQVQCGRLLFPGALAVLSHKREAIDLRTGDSVMPSGSENGLDLAVIDPLLDGRVAHPQLAGSLIQFEQVHVSLR